MDVARIENGRACRAAVLAVAAVVLLASGVSAGSGESFPKLANVYFPSLGTADLKSLARYDVLVLPKRAQEWDQKELGTLRELNPDIVLLVHMPLGYNGAWMAPEVNGDLTRKLNECDWWMRDTACEKVLINARDGLLNVTTGCPTDDNGDRLCEWLPEFIAERMGPGGYWDGVYLDYCMDRIDWLNQYTAHPIDANRDGVGEERHELNASWREGTEIVVSRLRELVGDEYILATNGNNTHYSYCDGSTREDFPNMHGDWYENITNQDYGYMAIETGYRKPGTNIINAIWRGTYTEDAPVWTSECERTFRFTLASTLVYGDGYFSFDGPSHCQAWWHEYYEVDLGNALGRGVVATAIPGGRTGVEHADMIRLRRFEKGIAVVNPTECEQEVHLGGFYYDLASWNGAFYPAAAVHVNVGLGAQSGEILAGNGRMIAEVGGLTAERSDGVAVLSWNPVAAARAYSVYRIAIGDDGLYLEPQLIEVVDVPWFQDPHAEGSGSRYIVAAIDQNGCEGRLSCPVEVSLELGSDLSLALMIVDEPDGALALTWDPDGVERGVVFDLVRTDEAGERVRITDEAIDPRSVWRWVDDSAVRGGSYVYEAVARIDGEEVTLGSATWTVTDEPPSVASVQGCYPHPMSDSATIAFDVPSDCGRQTAVATSLTIYDAAGRIVRRLIDGTLPPGRHAVAWEGVNDSGERVASGCYLYALGIGGDRLAGKLLVVR